MKFRFAMFVVTAFILLIAVILNVDRLLEPVDVAFQRKITMEIRKKLRENNGILDVPPLQNVSVRVTLEVPDGQGGQENVTASFQINKAHMTGLLSIKPRDNDRPTIYRSSQAVTLLLYLRAANMILTTEIDLRGKRADGTPYQLRITYGTRYLYMNFVIEVTYNRNTSMTAFDSFAIKEYDFAAEVSISGDISKVKPSMKQYLKQLYSELKSVEGITKYMNKTFLPMVMDNGNLKTYIILQ